MSDRTQGHVECLFPLLAQKEGKLSGVSFLAGRTAERPIRQISFLKGRKREFLSAGYIKGIIRPFKNTLYFETSSPAALSSTG